MNHQQFLSLGNKMLPITDNDEELGDFVRKVVAQSQESVTYMTGK